MNTLDIILLTISAMLFLEGIFYALSADYARKGMMKIFKKRKDTIKLGLIEIILALLILFILIL